MEVVNIVRFFLILNVLIAALPVLGLDFARYSTQAVGNDPNTLATSAPLTQSSTQLATNGSLHCPQGRETSLACRVEYDTKDMKFEGGSFIDTSLGEGFWGSTIKSLQTFGAIMVQGVLLPGNTLYSLLSPGNQIPGSEVGIYPDITQAQSRFRFIPTLINTLMYFLYAIAIIQLLRGVTFGGAT